MKRLTRIVLRVAGLIFMLASIIGYISWLMFLGILLLGISLFFSPERRVDRTPSTRQFIAYSTLFTIGIVVVSIGISWLTFVGAAVGILSAFFSSQWPATSRIFLPLFIFSGCAVADFIWKLENGNIFSRTPPPLWFLAFLIGALLWGIISEYRAWYKGRL